jgi:photosystem II stability/assembly factor-like uncharacterized protein
MFKKQWVRHRLKHSLLIVICACIAIYSPAQEVPSSVVKAMQWRLIGPYRGGRVTSVCGIPNQPSVYYMGTPGGGVWKTEDGGRVWKPIFDQVPVASIGAVVVSPSNPRIVYVGTGEQSQGNGVYKSSDGGATWANVGLRDTHVITGMVLDPRNPDVILVGAEGDHTSGSERGVFKSTDGGKNWQKVLFKDDLTGVVNLEVSPDDANVLYAALLTMPENPFNQDRSKSRSQDAAIYKSTDQGTTWQPIEGKGLPVEPMGRVGVSISPGTNSRQVFAIASQGLFRSDDGGTNWQRSTTDPRITGNFYFSRVFVDPLDAQKVYVAQTSMYRSTDGGRTFAAWVGAPSGDDFHVIWVNPADNHQMILGVDQGAIISMNSGDTWTSWYNQPTGQFYHVSTDQQYPYFVYGAQQDSGTAGVPSRSDYGEISFRDWSPVGGFEFAFIEADPLNPNFVYAGGWYGTVLRYDKITGQVVHLFTRTGRYRSAQMTPIAFSPQDPHVLYIAAQYLLKTTDGGQTWAEASPDLTVKADNKGDSKEKEEGKSKPEPRPGVINTLSLSRVKPEVMWAGTSNGLIQVTQDGKSWQDVTMTGLPEHSSVTMVESSPLDASAAYAVIGAFRNPHPLIYRTLDFGKTWQLIATGLPDSWGARAVKADPVRRGLLFAGTGNGVYFSLDDGDHWQSLQLNLPTATVTDLDVHSDDLVVSTFGRSLWILDDITPLRQFDSGLLQATAFLMPPRPAVRTRWDMNQDTPLPPETPAGKNPPDGAIINYFLKGTPRGEIKLSIYDEQNKLVNEYSSVPAPLDATPANVPNYWFEPPVALSKEPGVNRFTWNLRYPPPKALRYGYFGEQLDYIEYTLADHAIPGETPREQPFGPLIVPGAYSLVLKVDGHSLKQPLAVTLDPRVHASQEDLVQQLDTAKTISSEMSVTYDAFEQVSALRSAIAERMKGIGPITDAMAADTKQLAEALKALEEHAAKLATGKSEEPGFGILNRELGRAATMVESGDARPAALLRSVVDKSCEELPKRLSDWGSLNQSEAQNVNAMLQKSGLALLPVKSEVPKAPECK